MRKLTVYLAALLLFLLPLKFGGLAVMPEYGGFFPEFFIDWLFVTWHPHALAYAGTLLLAAALLTTKKKQGKNRCFSPFSGAFCRHWQCCRALSTVKALSPSEKYHCSPVWQR